MRRLVLALAGLVLLAGCGGEEVLCGPCPGDQLVLTVRSADPSVRRVEVRVCIDGADCFRSRVRVVRGEDDFGDSVLIRDLGESADLDGRVFRVTFDDGVSPPVTTVGRLTYTSGSGDCGCGGLYGETGVVLDAQGPRADPRV